MARIGPTQGFGSSLCGNFRESVQPLDEATTLEAFANLEPNIDEPEIERFTEQYGLLRWNWTHEGQGGSRSDQFVMPLSGFKQSQKDLQDKWLAARARRPKERNKVIEWLSAQLEKQSAVNYADSAEDMWKLSQPRMNIGIKPGDHSGLQVDLVLGDLWQALCCQMLDRLLREQGAFLRCSNDRCKRFFLKQGKETKFCKRKCAKQVSDRRSSKKRRKMAKKQGGETLKAVGT